MPDRSDAKSSKEKSSLQKRLYRPCLVAGIILIIGIAVMPLIGEMGIASPKTAEGAGLWINFFGKFHPLFLHLPIGALTLVLIMELGRLFSGGRYQPQTTIALFFTSVTGVFAVVFGYFLYLTGSFGGELIEEHKRDGIIFTILVIIAFLLKYTADLKPEKVIFKPLYGVALLASVGSMIATGHHGGEVTHGNPFDSLPSVVLEKRNSKDAKPPAEDINQLVVYTEIIHPILEEKCISCHGPKKKKSGLRMDTYEYMLDGGDEDECLVPGKIERSGLITTLHLPDDDDLRMPPLDEPQLTAAEIKLLEWWVKIGAPEKAKLSEVEKTEEIDQALQSVFAQ